MNTSRLSFDRPQASCDACGIPLAATAIHTLQLALAATPLQATLCAACDQRVQEDGVAPPPLTPRFEFEPVFHLPIVTLDDLRAVRREILRRLPSNDSAIDELIARSENPGVVELDTWTARLKSTSSRPTAKELAAALLAAATLQIELLPEAELGRMVDRSDSGDEIELCFAAYCVRLAGIEHWRPDSSELTTRARHLLETADRRFLLATLRDNHPLASLSASMRAGVALVLRRGDVADSVLLRLPRDDPRARLLRGLRLAQQENLAGSDREFRAAADDPMIGFDAELGGAALWNKAVRAISATRWNEARDCLRNYCRLHPDDVAARFVLGHAWLRSALAEVAREVFASVFDDRAIEHLRTCVEAGNVTPAQRAEAAVLYATCLVRLGDITHARTILERELAQDPVPADRATELHRALAQCALAQGRSAEALEHLTLAWDADHTREVAGEVAFAATAVARDVLGTEGLTGFLALLESSASLRDALRRHYGSLQLFLTAAFAVQQITTDQRPAHGFGMEWTWLRLRGADSNSSSFQAFAALARHQLALGLHHDFATQASGGGAIPLSMLAALFTAARNAGPDRRAALIERLQGIVATLALELSGTPDAGSA